jgi:DNA repair protein RecO (recombination protein O)
MAESTLPGTRRDASGLVAAHLQWHLERQLRSLPLVERRARETVVTSGASPRAGGSATRTPEGQGVPGQ